MGTSKQYNSVPVKDNCMLFATTPLFLDPGYPMVSFKFLPRWPPVAMATNHSYSKTKLAAAYTVTPHIIFSLHQLPLPTQGYFENSK